MLIEDQRVPEEWKKTIYVPFFFKNKGSKLDCANPRGIIIISIPSKLFVRVLMNKIEPHIEMKLHGKYAVFRAGRMTMDQILP